MTSPVVTLRLSVTYTMAPTLTGDIPAEYASILAEHAADLAIAGVNAGTVWVMYYLEVRNSDGWLIPDDWSEALAHADFICGDPVVTVEVGP